MTRKTVNHRPHRVYFHILRAFKPIILRPRNGVIHDKATLGGLCIEPTIKTVGTLRFGRTAVIHTIFHSKKISRHWHCLEIKRKNVNNNAGYPGTRQKNGYLGTRPSKWHYPAGKVGSELHGAYPFVASTRKAHLVPGCVLMRA